MNESTSMSFKATYFKEIPEKHVARGTKEADLKLIHSIQTKFYEGISDEGLKFERDKMIRSKLELCRSKSKMKVNPLLNRKTDYEQNLEKVKKFKILKKQDHQKQMLFINQKETVKNMIKGFIEVFQNCKQSRKTFYFSWVKLITFINFMKRLKFVVKKKEVVLLADLSNFKFMLAVFHSFGPFSTRERIFRKNLIKDVTFSSLLIIGQTLQEKSYFRAKFNISSFFKIFSTKKCLIKKLATFQKKCFLKSVKIKSFFEKICSEFSDL